jgi:hypothetical protein
MILGSDADLLRKIVQPQLSFGEDDVEIYDQSISNGELLFVLSLRPSSMIQARRSTRRISTNGTDRTDGRRSCRWKMEFRWAGLP